MGLGLTIKYKPTKSLTARAQNPRTHSEAQIKQLIRSIEGLRARHAWIVQEREKEDAAFRRSQGKPPNKAELLGKP